jgi:hypothetical protein
MQDRSPQRWTLSATLIYLLVASLSGCNSPKKPVPKCQLEFHILATKEEDAAIVTATQKWFADVAMDAERRDKLQKMAEEGQAPPVPEIENGPRYIWLEIGPSTIRALRLDHDRTAKQARKAEGDQDPRAIADEMAEAAREREWNRIAEAREAREPVPPSLGDPSWIWTRKCESTKLTKEQRDQKRYEYFLLARLTDPKAAVSETHLTGVKIDRSTRAVQFSLDKTGSDRLRELTEHNKGREMVAVVDGKIICKSLIRAAVSSEAQLAGNFTEKELDELADLLGAEKK